MCSTYMCFVPCADSRKTKEKQQEVHSLQTTVHSQNANKFGGEVSTVHGPQTMAETPNTWSKLLWTVDRRPWTLLTELLSSTVVKTLTLRLLIFITALPHLAVAQNFHFEKLTEFHGLSDNRVTCFLKDRTGFMWIGTENGLN